MELPSHRETDDTTSDQEPATRMEWGTLLGFAVVAILVVVMVMLHLTGVVGPRAH